MDIGALKIKNAQHNAGNGDPKARLRAIFFIPALFLIALLLLWLLPTDAEETQNISLRTLEIPEFPIIAVLEEKSGAIRSAWLRTPAGARKLDGLEGLSFISSDPALSKVDQDAKNDLLWRLSFTNSDGEGVHLWIGMTTWAPNIFLARSPFRYTRWHALPAKLDIPKGAFIYIAPSTPRYRSLDKEYEGTESYTFIYTVMMTPEGPSFVPVPDLYRQLSVLLKAGMQGESSPQKRLAYVRMLAEFDRLAEGKAPQADTLLNFPMEKIDVLTWKR